MNLPGPGSAASFAAAVVAVAAAWACYHGGPGFVIALMLVAVSASLVYLAYWIERHPPTVVLAEYIRRHPEIGPPHSHLH